MNARTKKQDAVVVVGPLWVSDLGALTGMLTEALKAIGPWKAFPILRIIPCIRNRTDAITTWATKRQAELDSVLGSAIRMYDHGNPITRNNLAIMGADGKTGEKALHGKAKAVIMLGKLPPHYIPKNSKDGQMRASGPESLFYHWQKQDDSPTLVQVVQTGFGDQYEVAVNPGDKWVLHGSKRTILEPPPKASSSGVDLTTENDTVLAQLGLS